MLNTETLRQFIPLNLISSEHIHDVLKSVKLHKVPKGTIIFKRGKSLTDYHFLLDGQINLINSDFGADKIISGSERATHSLNLKSSTDVSATAKTEITYLAVDINLIDKTVAMADQTFSESSQDLDYAVDIGMEVGELNDHGDWMSCLLNSPLFSRIPMKQLQELFGKFEKIYVRKGEKVVKEGARGDYFYVLASGTASVSNRSGSVAVQLKAGDYFGEEALISDSPRNASVVMNTDGIIRRLDSEDFASLVKEPVLRYVSWKEMAETKQAWQILDVRMPIEYRGGHAPGSQNIPLSKLRNSTHKLEPEKLYAVSSEGGVRSEIAAYILCQAGFDVVIVQLDPNSGSHQISNVS